MTKKRKTISETRQMIATLRSELGKHQNIVETTTLMPDKMNMAINVIHQLIGGINMLEWSMGDKDE